MSKNTTKKNSKNILTTVSIIIAAILVIGLAVFNAVSESGFFTRNKIAMESENYEIDGMMMTYFIESTIQPYNSYFSLMGVDTTKSLKDQAYSESQTWYEYFAESTVSYLGEVLTLCEYANENGIELDDASREAIEHDISDFEATALEAGYTLDTYLTLLFGSGMKVSDIENCLELTYLADVAYTHYSESIDYSDEELLEYREANPDSFSGVDYVKVVLASSDFTVFDEDGVSTSTEDEDKEAAAAEAEKFNQAQTVEEFKALIAEYFTAIHEDHEGHEEGEELAAAEDAYTRHALKTDLEEDVATWAFSAKVGETKVVKNDSGTEITVYMLAKTAYIDETLTRNVRHILFSTDSYEDDTKAKEVYAEWEADEFSDGKFVSLEYLYNEDTGSNENAGEYENLAPGATVAEFDAWLFDEEREVGDHDIVESSYGWHIMQYLGESDVPAWQAKAKDYKASDDYQTFITAGKEKVTHNHDIISGLDF